MLYDMKAHLPSIIERMMAEDYRNGDIAKLENDKTIILKLLSDDKEFMDNMHKADMIHKKQKEPVISKLVELDAEIKKHTEHLDGIERDYWETVIGEITRCINTQPNIPPSE